MRNINEFRARMKNGGARTSLFEVQLTNPINGIADLDVPIMCKAASLPGTTVTPIEMFHFGRAIKVPGNRTFEEWNITIYNDEDFKIRNAMEQWANAINSPVGNIRKLPSSEQALYKSDAIVSAIGQAGNILRTYKFSGIWPTSIAPLEMSWDNEAIAETQITLAVDFFTVEGASGNAGGI